MKRLMIVVTALSLLLAGAIFIMPSSVAAAPWISGADSYAAEWVKEVEQELLRPEYREVFLNDPRTPQAPVLRLLNRAAIAYDAHDVALAQDMVHQAIEVLEEGVRKQYYGESDIAPVISSIQKHIPFAPRQAKS
ncbi:MAG TPA: hypothetical protein VJV04_03395 [Nitrospiraceae bacterium]|nr:hypothetical protein [Nitrospiraceae bacterium]